MKTPVESPCCLAMSMGRFAAVAMLMAFSAAVPGGEGSLSVMPLDAASRELQYKANQLYESGKFERVLFIYKNDLAAAGDKYAQYMLGYMYDKGKGVPPDPIAASAWYRIAASGRGRSEFAEAAEASVRSMTPSDRELADAKYLELRKQYSDAVVVFRQVEKDLALLNQPDTLLPEGSQSISATGNATANDSFERKLLETRISRGLSYLASELDEPAYDVAYTEIDVAALSEDVDAWTSRAD